MVISEELLEKLQQLAMIDVTKDEAKEMMNNLNEILGFIDNLSAVDTDNIALTNNAKAPLRDDVQVDSHISEDVLTNAPKAQDGFFIVPKIIE